MSKEKDLKFFFEASIDFFRKKTLEKITDQKQKSKILSTIGVTSRNIKDFQLLLDLFDSLDSNERGLAGIELANAGFLAEARSVAEKITDTETAFDLLLHIAAISRDDTDFQKATMKIEDIKTELTALNLPDLDGEIKHRTKDARRKLIEELARAGKYERANVEIEKIEYGEFLHGVVAKIIIENSYKKETSVSYVVDPQKVADLSLAFKYALSGDKEYAVLALYLLANLKEFDLARKLVEEISDRQYPYIGNYIKARCYIGLASATHTPEDANNAFKYGMLSVATEGTGKGYGAEKALEILVLLGTLGRSLYHLGLAYDLALKSDKSQWEIDHILGQLSRLKS